MPIMGERSAVQDFSTEDDLRALRKTLYREVRKSRRQNRVVHLCISGGRKVMGASAILVAQLLFSAEDRVWHLISEGWKPGGEVRMHAAPQDKIWLVPVPVLRWTDSVGLLTALGELDDPEEALRRQEHLARADDLRRVREFVERKLTRAEREVVRLACLGWDNAAIAAHLVKSEATVANQLTSAYAKLNEFLDFPERPPDRAVLVATLGLYFALRKEVN